MYIIVQHGVYFKRKGYIVFGGLETFVAWRYLLTKKKTGFISIISVISIAGIALGVAALIIVLSLMNGFTKELRMRLVGMDGHIWITEPLGPRGGMTEYRDVMDVLSGIRGVTGISPFCKYKTVARDRALKNIAAVEVRGVDLETIGTVSDIEDYITDGYLDFTADEENVPGIVIGRYLALTLGSYEVGDTIYLYGFTEEDIESFFDSLTPPPIHPFRITGIFDSGYYEYDNMVALIDMAEAQRIIGYKDKVSGIVMKIENVFDSEKFTRKGGLIEEKIGRYPYYSEDWRERYQILFNWMKLEKWASFIVLSLIILVAAFNIVSSLIMMVMDKTREVGILKSMGATNSSIRRIFVYQGMFVGVCGTIMGCVTGYVLCYIQEHYRILSLPSEVYFVSAVPVELMMRDVVSITVIALILCWLSSFYPAKKAADLNPVEAIRSE